MLNETRKNSLVDIRIRITYILAIITSVLFFITSYQPDFSYIYVAAIIFVLLDANFPCLFFAIGINRDEGWILSTIGIEGDHVISKSKELSLDSVRGWLEVAVLFLISEIGVKATGDIFFARLALCAIVLGIYYVSRMITQTMGFYRYWIARINNDPKLKSNAPNNIIIVRSLKAAGSNYFFAGFIIAFLLMLLLAYFFAEFVSSITPFERRGFILYAVLLFIWIVMLLNLGQLFDKNAALINIFGAEYINEQYSVTIENTLQQRLLFIKFLYALFIFAELLMLPVIIRTIL